MSRLISRQSVSRPSRFKGAPEEHRRRKAVVFVPVHGQELISPISPPVNWNDDLYLSVPGGPFCLSGWWSLDAMALSLPCWLTRLMGHCDAKEWRYTTAQSSSSFRPTHHRNNNGSDLFIFLALVITMIVYSSIVISLLVYPQVHVQSGPSLGCR